MMSDQPGFFSRLGHWLKGVPSSEGESKPNNPDHDNGEHAGNEMMHVQSVDATRGTFLRPWAKRDAAINHLQEGFSALTGLMGAVKDSLEKQTQRQDELMQVLSSLPEVLRSIPESGEAQTATLRAIADQIKDQNTQQAKLGEILEKVAETGGDQREMLDGLRERIENLNEQDRNIADSLTGVGSAMQNVSKTSQTSAQVLEQMRDNINSREGELQRILNKQGARYTTMLAIAIFLAITALVAVCVMGYLMLNKLK
jgi:chromosome segregation ATPase